MKDTFFGLLKTGRYLLFSNDGGSIEVVEVSIIKSRLFERILEGFAI